MTGMRWLAVALSACSLVACDTAEPNKDEPYCAVVMRARLDGSWYLANGDIRVLPTYGERLGMATIPPCEGQGGSRIAAFSIVGVNPSVAFASPDFEEVVFIAQGTHALPRALERLRTEPACEKSAAPISLTGPWLGILGPHHETELDLVPPYTLEMRVNEASSTRYERTFLTIHVSEDAGRPITHEDVRSSLREGGDLVVIAACRDREFWAQAVEARPPT